MCHGTYSFGGLLILSVARILVLLVLGIFFLEDRSEDLTAQVISGLGNETKRSWLNQVVSTLPAVPNVLSPASCKGWHEFLSLPRLVLALLFAVAPVLAWTLLAYLAGSSLPNFVSGWWRLIQGFIILISAILGYFASAFVSESFPSQLQGYIDLPDFCEIHWIDARHLKFEQWRFYMSLAFWQIIAACLTGQLLTALGRCWRFCKTSQVEQARSASRMSKDPSRISSLTSCDQADKSEPQQIAMRLIFGLHFFCGTLSLAMIVYDMSAWEVYVCWSFMILAAQFLQSMYSLALAMDDPVPCFGLLMVQTVALGEPMYILKDWIFTGLALSQRSSLGSLMAFMSMAILRWSSVYLQRHHPRGYAALLAPIYGDGEAPQILACRVAVVLTEDVPQVCLQSIFVCFVQSNLTTQVLFLAFSSIKIASSLAQCWIENNWSVMLELYYHIKLQLVRFCRGSDSEEALKNQSDLATHLHHEGKLPSAWDLWEDTAIMWKELGHFKEAHGLLQQVLVSQSAVLGPDHPETQRARRLAETMKHGTRNTRTEGRV